MLWLVLYLLIGLLFTFATVLDTGKRAYSEFKMTLFITLIWPAILGYFIWNWKKVVVSYKGRKLNK